MMWTLDASVITRSFERTAPDHTTCLALVEHLDQHAIPVIIPRLLLAEIAGSVRRIARDPIRARLAAEAWKHLPHVQVIALSDDLLDEAAFIAADRALKGADAVYVAVARRHSCTLVTLDRAQRERAAPVVPVMTPQEALDALTPP